MSRYQVKIEGQGFLIRPGSYRRTASTPGVQHATGYPGWRYWRQSNWRGGDGYAGSFGVEAGSGEPGRWRSGSGLEIEESGKLRLGPALSASYLAGETGVAAMAVFQGELYALSTSSGRIHRYDGSGWTVDHDTGKSSLASLARFGSRLHAGSGSDGTVFQGDGATWSVAFQVAGAARISAMASYGTWDPEARATVPGLFVGCRFPGEEARIYRWDGISLAEVSRCREAEVEAMAVYRGRLYVATSDEVNGVQGRILCYDGGGASGEWSEAVWLPDNYVAGWALFDNLLFCGSGVGGKLWAFDGSRLVDGYRLPDPPREGFGPLRAMAAAGGRLYVGYRHPAEGPALLSKLPSAAIADPATRPGDNREIDYCGQGWCTPCTAGEGGNALALAVYGGCLYLAGEAGGAAAIYRKDPDSYRGSGLMETPLFDGGQPDMPKLLRSLTLSHDRLLPGHHLEVGFALEGSESLQIVEEFDDLSGCDLGLTTADWRPADSLVRLKGMPAQGFEGKRRGDPSVPHEARKLVSADPNAPPALFSEEFDDAEYGAIAGAGGMAVISGEKGYAFQLFQFDLAGLSPVGLRPRVVCYGLGSSFGAPAPGVQLRIWNHGGEGWDLMGSHQASPEDGVNARTLTADIGDWKSYAGPSGRVYLSLRSAYQGDGTRPAEMGCDLAKLDALWDEAGEVVSSPPRLPLAEPVSGAALTLLSSSTPAGTSMDLFLSTDGGEHWEAVENGIVHAFAYPGVSLRWKTILAGDGGDTPWVGRLKLDCFAEEWLFLGRSDTEGSTGAAFDFPPGTTARRVAFRIELGSSDPSTSPGLAGVTLAYALQPEVRRQWEMDLICEGVPGVPTRLMDGSRETRTGRELSQALWQARARGVVSFEDLDGGSHRAWFEGMEERLSDAAQEQGIQTVARCRLVEC